MTFYNSDLHKGELEIRRMFDFRREWRRLKDAGVLADDVTFEEFMAAFESIQQDLVRSGSCNQLCRWHGDTSGLRGALSRVSTLQLWRLGDREIEKAVLDAIRSEKLMVRPGNQQIARRIRHERAVAAAAAYWGPRLDEVARERSARREANRRAFRYHEQFHLVDEVGGASLAYAYYEVESDSGEKWTGSSDADGLTQHIYTDRPEKLSLTVYQEVDDDRVIE